LDYCGCARTVVFGLRRRLKNTSDHISSDACNTKGLLLATYVTQSFRPISRLHRRDRSSPLPVRLLTTDYALRCPTGKTPRRPPLPQVSQNRFRPASILSTLLPTHPAPRHFPHWRLGLLISIPLSPRSARHVHVSLVIWAWRRSLRCTRRHRTFRQRRQRAIWRTSAYQP